ncbi:hypothetical protein GQX73_g10280 [Xylaria multiplex]|uniref:Uncharacterized protein n=1 Tax=Xylaria multiplex TaxID=323545 RepID=A0A7C8MIF8_9PEZI|nr:hypothetical protein GQX73_g10280 [Xylaria multiplex]
MDLDLFFVTQWTTTVNKLKGSLDPDDLDTIKQSHSLNETLDYVLQCEVLAIVRIGPALGHLGTFSKFFQQKLSRDLDTSFLWGSLTCLLKLAAEDEENLGQIPRLVKSLAHKAEAFNSYTSEAHVVGNLVKETCFDIQILFVEFLTASILYIHEAGEHREIPGTSTSRQEAQTPAQRIERRYRCVNQDVTQALERVEKLIQTNVPTRVDVLSSEPRSRYLMRPHTHTTRMFDRVDVFLQLDDLLDRKTGSALCSVAMHGLGGIGKSTIASSYLERKYNENIYDICLWVRGETELSLQQSFTEIALRMKLPGARHQQHDENLVLVQDWLQSTGALRHLIIKGYESNAHLVYKWLIVYDNVEDAETIMPYWLRSIPGKAIITTRNRSLAFEPASFGLEVTSWDGQMGCQFLFFLLRNSVARDTEAEEHSALALSQRLSGHALALQHMATLIHSGRFSIEEFMTMYLSDPRRAHASDELTALWDFSFRSLDKESFALLGVLSFLMPDQIPQEIFEHRESNQLPEGLKFCSDNFSLSAAISKLLKLALIKRDRDMRILSIHRVVQAQFKGFLSTQQRWNNFYRTVDLVRHVFPRENTTAGQLYDVWEACNTYAPHVINLKDCFNEEHAGANSKTLKVTSSFCELLADCGRYMYETNALKDCEALCQANLAAIESMEDVSQKNDLKATVLSHLSQMYESLGNAEQSIELAKEGYQIRLSEETRKYLFLCHTCQNLGFMCNTANRHQEALDWFSKLYSWWDSLQKSRGTAERVPAIIPAGHVRAKIYANDYQGVTDLLHDTFARYMEECPVNWAMIGYLYFAEGTMKCRQGNFALAENVFIKAQNSWLKTDKTRLHPFNGGCMYRIGTCSLEQGKVEAAIKHLRESLEITKFHSRMMPMENGRSLLALSLALAREGGPGHEEESRRLRGEAEVLLKRRKPEGVVDDVKAFDDMIPIFWR